MGRSYWRAHSSSSSSVSKLLHVGCEHWLSSLGRSPSSVHRRARKILDCAHGNRQHVFRAAVVVHGAQPLARRRRDRTAEGGDAHAAVARASRGGGPKGGRRPGAWRDKHRRQALWARARAPQAVRQGVPEVLRGDVRPGHRRQIGASGFQARAARGLARD
eukprot:1337927-Prymnesium_polylepis.1